MNFELLSQFNPKLFKKFLGQKLREKRLSLGLTPDDLSKQIQYLTVNDLIKLEGGRKSLTDEQLAQLIEVLQIDSTEIYDIARVTQVQTMMSYSREINEHFPK